MKKRHTNLFAEKTTAKQLTDLFLPLLNLIWQGLDPKSRARMATSCKLGQQALLKKAWPITTELDLTKNPEMNTWLCGVVPELPPCSCLTIRLLEFNDAKWQGLFTTSLVHLMFQADLYLTPRQELETFVESNKNQILQKMSSLSKLQNLHIPCVLWESISKLPNLTCLTIHGSCSAPPDFEKEEFVHLAHPNVTELELDGWHSLPASVDLPQLEYLYLDTGMLPRWQSKFNTETIPGLESLRLYDEHNGFEQLFEQNATTFSLLYSISSLECEMNESTEDGHCVFWNLFRHATQSKKFNLEQLTVYLQCLNNFDDNFSMKLLIKEAEEACPRLWKIRIQPSPFTDFSEEDLQKYQNDAGDQWIVADCDAFEEPPSSGQRVLILLS